MVLSRNLPTDDQLGMNETLSESKFFNWRLLFVVATITMNFSLGIVSSLHQNVLLAQKILFSTQIHVTFLQFLPQIQAGIIQINSNIRKILLLDRAVQLSRLLFVCLWEDRIVSILERHLQNHILVTFWKTNVIQFFSFWIQFLVETTFGQVKINKHLWNNFELWF